MKIKTSKLIGPALDWAVAKCENNKAFISEGWLFDEDGFEEYSPSQYWVQGGPIIEREHLDIRWMNPNYYVGKQDLHCATHFGNGPTPLIAAMRCYVASKLGDEIKIPEELV